MPFLGPVITGIGSVLAGASTFLSGGTILAGVARFGLGLAAQFAIGQLIGNPFVISTVERIAGDLRVTLILPNGHNASEATAFPTDIINPPDGPIALPADPASAEPEEA